MLTVKHHLSNQKVQKFLYIYTDLTQTFHTRHDLPRASLLLTELVIDKIAFKIQAYNTIAFSRMM